MSKYNLDEGNESLKRIMLLMKYDNKKTLTENIDEQAGEMASSALEYAALGAAAGSFLPGPGNIIGGAIGAIYGLINGAGTSYNKINKTVKEYCSPEKSGKSTMSKQELNRIADKIFDAVDGMGTDEDSIKSAISELEVFPDFCEMAKRYENRHGETLMDSLDGDIDAESEWKRYVWLPVLDLVENTPEEKPEEKPEDGKKEGSKTSKYKKCSGTYKMYCFNKEVIGKVQKALGLKSDGAYGPKTQAALEKVGYKNGFTDADVSKIIGSTIKTTKEPNVNVGSQNKTTKEPNVNVGGQSQVSSEKENEINNDIGTKTANDVVNFK
jgi:hypothetical protein